MKKVFFLAMGLVLSMGAWAQDNPVDATIDTSAIRYWVGQGSNQVIFAVNWADPDTCLAWGYRFSSDSVTVETIMNDIQNADPRFWYSNVSGSVNDIFYLVDDDDTLSLEGNYWLYNIDGTAAMLYFNTQKVGNGQFVKWGDVSVATGYNWNEQWQYYEQNAWTTTVTAVDEPHDADAEIDDDQILFWVGSGSNEVILAVNWANPDTCLAWGVRFNGTAMVKDIMDAIVAADPRFSYEVGDYGIGDIKFVAGTDTLKLQGSYWLYNLNGRAALLGYDQQPVADDDFIKWGDPSVSVGYNWNAEWQYYEQHTWTTTVTPVSVYQPVGIADVEAMSLVVWPNPATDRVNVSMSEAADAILYDINGRRMASFQLVEGVNTIDLSSYANGVYVLRTANATQKIVKR